MGFSIVGIGEILWDVFPDEERFGGAPSNFACTASELLKQAGEVRFVGAVGQDSLGHRAVELLQSRGVQTDAVQEHSAATGRVNVQLDAAGVATYVFDPVSAWDFLKWNNKLAEIATGCDAVCFGTLGQRGSLTRDTVRQFLQQTPRHALRILDINLRDPYFDDQLIRESIPLANVLKLNELELPIVANACDCKGSDQDRIVQLAERFELNTIALTKGSEGAVLYSQGEWSEQPPQPTQVADTVGAGDAYTAALTLGLLSGDSIDDINRKAIRVASYVCSNPGATMPIPFRYRDLD